MARSSELRISRSKWESTRNPVYVANLNIKDLTERIKDLPNEWKS